MKSEAKIRQELERQYLHRLQLRFDRKLKPCCRNCRKAVCSSVDLGIFGHQKVFCCKDGLSESPERECDLFDAVYTKKSIEEEMLSEIRDPAVCGAKEPKIAALLWVLHEDGSDGDGILAKICRMLGK